MYTVQHLINCLVFIRGCYIAKPKVAQSVATSTAKKRSRRPEDDDDDQSENDDSKKRESPSKRRRNNDDDRKTSKRRASRQASSQAKYGKLCLPRVFYFMLLSWVMFTSPGLNLFAAALIDCVRHSVTAHIF